jgi:hypothetical protein
MGPHEQEVILIGDFDEHLRYMKGLPPTQGIRFR